MPGRPSRSTPTAASAATPSATHRWNRTGSRELPRTGIRLRPVEQERELAQHQHAADADQHDPEIRPNGRALAGPPAPTTARAMAIRPI